ncbi:hypothetical protein CK203_065267 [Vitis vinifera]|uniref:Uncharacterized protein n=1 Tax=Vitis vinifera TaxID=29760 RepID=A0A438G2I1_VITVI|nr:hypothetical protein CK203_065267 [Vitis vinifera]
MQALLQETARLREENVVLRIQASSTGPPRATHAHAPSSPGGKLRLYSSLSKETTLQKTPVVRRDACEARSTGAWEAKVASSTTWGAHHEPLVTPMVQNVPRTKWYDKLGETSQTSHPLAPSAKGWTTCSSCLFALILFITTPQVDSSCLNSPRMMGPTTPSTHHALSTTHDSRYRKRRAAMQSIPRQPKGRPSHGFTAYLPTLLIISGTYRKLSWDNTYAPLEKNKHQHSAKHKNAGERVFEGIREAIWLGRVTSRGLQHGCFPADLQAKHLPGTPFFESLAKKPPTRMDDLFQCASKYSMLEDDVRTATQQILVAGQASRSGAKRNAKLPDRLRPSGRKQEEQSRPELPSLTPLSISYEKLLPMIQDISDFSDPDPSEWTHPKGIIVKNVPTIRSMVTQRRRVGASII